VTEFDEIITAWVERHLWTGLAFATGFARIIAVLQIFPLFTALNVRGSIRATLALVLAIPLVPMIEPQLMQLGDPDLWVLASLMVKEFVFGLLLGCLVAIPFWGIQSAGDVIDVSRGASAANVADPVNADENSQTGLILLYASLAIFVVAGGLQLVIELVYHSYSILRITDVAPPMGMTTIVAIGDLLTRMFTLGVIISGPMMIALIAVDLSLVFASRIAKQIQVSEFAMIVKNLCVCAFIPLYALFLEEYMLDDWRDLMRFVEAFLLIGEVLQ
jgi:type III secretion protein T